MEPAASNRASSPQGVTMMTRKHTAAPLRLSRAHWRRYVYLASRNARTAATNPCEPEILRAADRYGVPAGILYAVGLTETGKERQPSA